MTKKHLALVGLSLATISVHVWAQNDPVLMTVNGSSVTKSEFEYVYKKNNNENSIEKKTLGEYKNLFVDFRLKVEEAKAKGIDTTRQFINEFNSYKNQLLAPYLLDTVSDRTFAKSIFDRTRDNVEVSHILLRFEKEELLPADTLKIFKKALELRKKLSGKKPMKFTDLAQEASEDPSAKTMIPAGYLGWGGSGTFVAPFEEAMYSMKPGEISGPIRSRFGYHLIQVHNRRPDPGMVNVAHIMFRFQTPEPAQETVDSLKQIADSVYLRLKANENFLELCEKYSEDTYSAKNGGEIGFFEIASRIPNEFKNAAFDLKQVGEITPPVKTDFGWHILKLIEKKPQSDWAESKGTFIDQITRGDRRGQLRKYQEQTLANKLDCELNTGKYAALQEAMNETFPNDSNFLDKLNQMDKPLFTINGNPYPASEFAQFIPQNMRAVTSNLSTEMFDDLLTEYLYSKLQEQQKLQLETKNSDIKNLIKEYHDGILLFDIMNREVWERASTDTLGLEKYFSANKTKYTWEAPKYKGTVLLIKDKATLDKVNQILKNNKKATDWLAPIREAFAKDTLQSVRVERGLWSKGENKYVDFQIFSKGKGTQPEPNPKYPLFMVNGKLIASPEDYPDVRGLVISDYQDQLEKDWMQSLRKKYKVEIDESVLNSVK